jgi:hypothetical protein
VETLAAVDPSVLVTSWTNWQQGLARDRFLALLVEHLDMLRELGTAHIAWSDDLELELWGDPPVPPWRIDQTWKFRLVPVIFKLLPGLVTRIDDVISGGEAEIQPPLNDSHGRGELIAAFLRIVHALVCRSGDFYLVLGMDNLPPPVPGFAASCECHPGLVHPTIVASPRDWLRLTDFTDAYWPTGGSEKEASRFVRLVELTRLCSSEQGAEPHEFVYEFEPTGSFLEALASEGEDRGVLMQCIVERLVLPQRQASALARLNDEPVRGKHGVRRFRVGGGRRVHYMYGEDGRVVFVNYYPEGKHDVGLRRR